MADVDFVDLFKDAKPPPMYFSGWIVGEEHRIRAIEKRLREQVESGEFHEFGEDLIRRAADEARNLRITFDAFRTATQLKVSRERIREIQKEKKRRSGWVIHAPRGKPGYGADPLCQRFNFPRNFFTAIPGEVGFEEVTCKRCLDKMHGPEDV